MKNQETPRFSRIQLEYLQKVFPEITNCNDVNELIHNNGKRTVVKHIETLVLQHEPMVGSREIVRG